MNKKAQTDGLGDILLVFIAVLVGVIILTASAQLIGDTVNTQIVANDTLSSANGTSNLQGKFVSGVEVYNGTDDVIIDSSNYTIANNQVVDGTETARITVATEAAYQVLDWNISYTTQPTTYISNGGGRAVANLIVLFFAIAIALVALSPTLRSKVLEGFGR